MKERGMVAYEEGSPRRLPADLYNASTEDKQNWYRGWDAANLSAPASEQTKAAAFDAGFTAGCICQALKSADTITAQETLLVDAKLLAEAVVQADGPGGTDNPVAVFARSLLARLSAGKGETA